MPIRRDRYELHEVIGEGGMATVHLGTLSAPGGFRRIVAIKRLHPELAGRSEFTRLLVDEAKLASRVVHANVVQVLDVLEEDGETWLVMEHVAGETLARLHLRATERGEPIPQPIAVAIVVGILRGLHAAHVATAPSGELLELVHRDVSPQNVLVGADGIARVLDFGIARAAGRAQLTRPGYVRGKLSYMAPEQLRGDPLSRTADVYATAVVLWELLTGKRLFEGDSPAVVEALVLGKSIAPPSQVAAGLPMCLDRVALRALARDATLRFETAEAMAEALERCVTPASASDVAAWVLGLASAELIERRALVASVEQRGTEAAAPTALRAPAIPMPMPAPADDAHAQHTRARARPPFWIGAAAALAVAASLAMAAWVRSGAPPDRASATDDGSPLPIVVATAGPGATQPDATPYARDAGSPTDASPLAELAAPSRTASAAAGGRRSPGSRADGVAASSGSRAGTAPSSTAPPGDGCNPPYVVDDAGHRRFKRECL